MPGWSGKLEKVDDYRWRLYKSYKAGMRVDGKTVSEMVKRELAGK
jgi:hypothetical protein